GLRDAPHHDALHGLHFGYPLAHGHGTASAWVYHLGGHYSAHRNLNGDLLRDARVERFGAFLRRDDRDHLGVLEWHLLGLRRVEGLGALLRGDDGHHLGVLEGHLLGLRRVEGLGALLRGDDGHHLGVLEGRLLGLRRVEGLGALLRGDDGHHLGVLVRLLNDLADHPGYFHRYYPGPVFRSIRGNRLFHVRYRGPTIAGHVGTPLMPQPAPRPNRCGLTGQGNQDQRPYNHLLHVATSAFDDGARDNPRCKALCSCSIQPDLAG